MNEGNLKPIRSTEEARERGKKGGKASGVARRRKADFRKTLNMLLTAEIDEGEWRKTLQSVGADSTFEAAINMAMVREALSGNVKAYEAIAKYAGQSEKTDVDIREQKIRIDRAKRARDQEVGDSEGSEENIKGFLKAMDPTQEAIDQLFEAGEDDAEKAEETGEV